VVDTGVNVVSAGKQHNIPYMAGATSEDMMPPIIFSMARAWCARQEKPSYTWLFNRQLPGDNCGAWHSSDLWYWFGTLENSWRPMEQKDIDLSQQMVVYLDNFLRKGNPNKGGELPTWVASDRTQTKVIILGEKDSAMGRPNWLKMIYTMLFRKAVGV
jgi:para-nitrobenzyl esterase